MPPMNGARFLAETMHGYGVTHFFLMPVIIPEAMPHLEELGIQRVMGHSEKGVAYMADGYGRVSGRPGTSCIDSPPARTPVHSSSSTATCPLTSTYGMPAGWKRGSSKLDRSMISSASKTTMSANLP